MKKPRVAAGQLPVGGTTFDPIVAHHARPCPYSTDCQVVELRDPDGRVQAIACRACTMLASRTELHYDLTGTPGCSGL